MDGEAATGATVAAIETLQARLKALEAQAGADRAAIAGLRKALAILLRRSQARRDAEEMIALEVGLRG